MLNDIMPGNNELLNEYELLEKISKELDVHQKNIKAVGKRIAKDNASLDFSEGLIENLEIVSNHMLAAKRELDRAKEKLKSI